MVFGNTGFYCSKKINKLMETLVNFFTFVKKYNRFLNNIIDFYLKPLK